MRRGLRTDLYEPKQAPPDPLVPRQRIHPIAERIDSDGAELEPLDEESVDLAVAALRQAGAESVAVGLVFAFANDAHERAVASRVRDALPDVHVSLSSEVLPEVRLYERLSTTAVNAYVTPVLAAYLESLERRLADNGFRGRLLVMQSSGGVMGLDPARRFGVRSILSGPAAGPVAGLWYADLHGISNAITADMGGTSFDVCLAEGGEVEVTKETEISGHRIALPMVAVHTIGAGGGSIVTVDGRGLLRVGPDSAGSTPGPVCYGRGGDRPTVTDADLLIGYLGAERFWGGRLQARRGRGPGSVPPARGRAPGRGRGPCRLRRPPGGERQHGGRHPRGVGAARPRPASVRAGGRGRRRPHPCLRHCAGTGHRPGAGAAGGVGHVRRWTAPVRPAPRLREELRDVAGAARPGPGGTAFPGTTARGDGSSHRRGCPAAIALR